MQLIRLIPFTALLICSAFVAVAIAWNSDRRATRTMAGIFTCIGTWAIFDLLVQLEAEAAWAALWIRLSLVPGLLLGVMVMQLVVELIPATARELVPMVRRSAVGVLLFGLAVPFLPWVVTDVTPMSFGGWMPHYGPVALLAIPIGFVIPGLATYRAWALGPKVLSPGDQVRTRSIVFAVAIGMTAILTTEYILPILQIPFIGLGPLVTSTSTAALWLSALYRNDDLIYTPQGTARAVIAELHSGIALVDSSGIVLTSNPRLASIIECRPAQLLGTLITNWIDAPMTLIRAGLDGHEYRLVAASGTRVPVAISSSSVKMKHEEGNLFVIVFRDLRGVDALRRRLLTSGRLAAVGELAAGIAHEVNNPVAYIRSDLNFLRERLHEVHKKLVKENASGAELQLFESNAFGIDRALEGVERVAEVVDDVRGFAHVGAEPGSSGQAAVILESAIRLARLERRDGVRLDLVDGYVSEPVVSAQDLKQVVLALIRLLTVHCRVEGIVRVSYRGGDSVLRVTMKSCHLGTAALEQKERFDRVREFVLDAPDEDLGLAIAIELCDQLGGGVEVEAPSEDEMRIELAWPLAGVDPA